MTINKTTTDVDTNQDASKRDTINEVAIHIFGDVPGLILTSNEFRIYYHRETCKITHVELIAYSERSEVHITYPEEKEPENWSIIKKAFQQILQGEKAQ